jgi:glycosyltransferase involved in cell wall biosynthesis
MASICLCMIVKDESEVIDRCLASVRDLIDYWVICDTGSTDGTQQMITERLAGVPGELHERPWVDFGHNRTEALQFARGKADYLLLLDADWTFEAEPGALDDLSADVYLVRHEHRPVGDFELYNRHLVSGDIDFRYRGAAHEYIESDGPKTEAQLKGAVIVNWADGGVGRERRWQRDAELLERQLMREPGNARALFYLAQTYRDLGDTARAIELYGKRALIEGWDEEVYYSLYQVGVLRAGLGEWPAAVLDLMRAWEYRPARAEALFHLVKGLRERDLHRAAFGLARGGIRMAQPNDVLFVEPWIYRWGMLFEFSICAYWTGNHRAALTACDRLLKMPDLPDAYREQTVANREFCVQAIERSKAPRVVVRGQPPLGGRRPT